MTFEASVIVGIVIQIIVFAVGYGKVWQQVNDLKKIVCNGLTDKVTRIDKTVAVLADRQHMETGE